MGAGVIGSAAADVRRAVGPVAWCALEYLAASPPFGHGDEDAVAASVRSLAVGLGVSKNTAHRALAVLRAAGLVQPVQSRCGTGRFDAGCYRLAVPPAVAARVEVGGAGVGLGECVTAVAPPRAVSEPGRARAGSSRSRGRVEQLSLLPGG
jgi:DNA-binding transcriptional ArsR family regulator